LDSSPSNVTLLRMDQKQFQWGIIGCGHIAPRFWKALNQTGEGTVVAAASKSMRRAQRFQQKTGVKRIYTSYEAMLDREKLDAVYVATTHNFHAENTLLCSQRHLPALVEKSFTQNAQQAERIISQARKNRVFLMEAMWTRFNPATVKLRELLANNRIGTLRSVDAEFCVRMNPLSAKMMPWNRMFSPRLAGGALLDIGIYPIAFTRMIFQQPPATIRSSAQITLTNVDATSEYHFGYPTGASADIKASFVSSGSRSLCITGDEGRIEIPTFYRADKLILNRHDEPEKNIPCAEPGFDYQIREVHRCLREGLMESPSMPLSESLETMKTLDVIRAQWRMKYPGE